MLGPKKKWMHISNQKCQHASLKLSNLGQSSAEIAKDTVDCFEYKANSFISETVNFWEHQQLKFCQHFFYLCIPEHVHSLSLWLGLKNVTCQNFHLIANSLMWRPHLHFPFRLDLLRAPKTLILFKVFHKNSHML